MDNVWNPDGSECLRLVYSGFIFDSAAAGHNQNCYLCQKSLKLHSRSCQPSLHALCVINFTLTGAADLQAEGRHLTRGVACVRYGIVGGRRACVAWGRRSLSGFQPDALDAETEIIKAPAAVDSAGRRRIPGSLDRSCGLIIAPIKFPSSRLPLCDCGLQLCDLGCRKVCLWKLGGLCCRQQLYCV